MIKTIESLTYDFGGDLFIDIGANVGMWSKEMLGLYDKIIYIEPGSEAMHIGQKTLETVCIEKNISKDCVLFLKNVCYSVADQPFNLGAPTVDSGQLSVFADTLYDKNKVLMSETAVLSITLDSLVQYVDPSKTNIFIKIDTEGADLDVLIGGFEFIKQFKPVIFMEAHYHMHFDEQKHKTVVDTMKNLGYTVTEFKMPGYLAQPEHLFDGIHNGIQMYDRHLQMIWQPPTT